MDSLVLSPDLTIEQVLTFCREAASVLIRHRMACVGCPLSCFETLAAAAKNYGLAPEILIEQINELIQTGGAEQVAPSSGRDAGENQEERNLDDPIGKSGKDNS